MIERLTQKQRDVILLRAAGLDGKYIARLLRIGHTTVHRHTQDALATLGIRMPVGRRSARSTAEVHHAQ